MALTRPPESMVSGLTSDLASRINSSDLLSFAANNSLTPRGGVQYIDPFDTKAGHVLTGPWREVLDVNYPNGHYYTADGGTSAVTWKVTFTGTAISLFAKVDTNARTLYVSIDGGAYSALTALPVVATNMVRKQLASGLSYGSHTVTFYVNEAVGLNVAGFEVVTDPTVVKVDSGVGYVSGSRISPAAASLAPTAIGSSNSRCDLIVADNTGVVSLVSGTANTSVKAYRVEAESGLVSGYYLKDASGKFIKPPHSDTTKPDGPKIWKNGFGVQEAFASHSSGAARYTAASGLYIVIGWVGTQLDLICRSSTTVAASGVTAANDGGTATDISASFSTSFQKAITVASGLPYGYHQTNITNSQTAATIYIDAFDIYVPSAPSLPANTMALGQAYLTPTAPTGTGAPAPALMGGWVRYEEDKSVVCSGSGTWTDLLSQPDSSGGSYKRHDGANTTDYAEFTFVGSGVRLIAQVAPNGGIWAVSIDGGAETNVDMYNASVSVYQKITYSLTGLSFGAHTVKVRSTNTANASNVSGIKRIYLDAFDVLQPIEVLDVRNLSPVADQAQALIDAHTDPQGNPHAQYVKAKDIALGIERNIRIEAGNNGVGAVTFGKAFTVIPRVIVTSGSTTAAYVTAETTTGFTLNGSTSDWIAVGC